MTKKLFSLVTLLLVCFSYGQTWKSKSVEAPKISYPKLPPLNTVNTYLAEVINTEGSSLYFSNQEFKNAVQLQSLKLHEDKNASPGLLFGISGPPKEDFNVSVKRQGGVYTIEIFPSEKIDIKLLTMARGKPFDLKSFPVPTNYTPGVNGQNATVLPDTYQVKEDEVEKYLVFNEDKTQYKLSTFLANEYLKKQYGDDFLKKTIVPYIYAQHDLRVDLEIDTYYYIKDKANEALEDESKNKLEELESVYKNFNTYESLATIKTSLEPFKLYWEGLLQNYAAGDKKQKEARWGLLMNLFNVSMLYEDFDAASKLVDEIASLDYKKAVSGNVEIEFKNQKEAFLLNFNETTKERLNSTEYPVSPLLETIAKQKEADQAATEKLKVNLEKAPGYLITDKDEKLEGAISLEFITPPSNGGNIVSLDAEGPARKVRLTYLNDKGKQRTDAFKTKEVKEVVVGNKIYVPVNFKGGPLTTDSDALGLSLSNEFFMLRLYSSENVELFQDLRSENTFVVKFPNEKKGVRTNKGMSNDNFNEVTAEIFSSNKELSDRILSGEFQENEEDLMKIVRIYDGK